MSLRNAVRPRWAAVKRIPRFWASLALVILTAALWMVIRLSGGPDDRSDLAVRTWALFLQFLGGVIVMLDLTAAARAAGHEGLWRGVLRALRDIVWPKQITLTGSSSAIISASGSARGHVLGAIGPAKSIEERIAVLESNQARIDKELKDLGGQIERNRREVDEQIKAEADLLRREVADLRDSARVRVTANYAQLVFGAAWTLAGTVLSTYAQEFVTAFR